MTLLVILNFGRRDLMIIFPLEIWVKSIFWNLPHPPVSVTRFNTWPWIMEDSKFYLWWLTSHLCLGDAPALSSCFIQIVLPGANICSEGTIKSDDAIWNFFSVFGLTAWSNKQVLSHWKYVNDVMFTVKCKHSMPMCKFVFFILSEKY